MPPEAPTTIIPGVTILNIVAGGGPAFLPEQHCNSCHFFSVNPGVPFFQDLHVRLRLTKTVAGGGGSIRHTNCIWHWAARRASLPRRRPPLPMHFPEEVQAPPDDPGVQLGCDAGDRDDASSTASVSCRSSKARDWFNNVPLAKDGSTDMSCKGCGACASPTTLWVQYDPVYDDGSANVIVAKKPKGCVCRLCLTTFKASGWDATYGTIGQYFTYACTPAGRATHQEFLTKRKALKAKVADAGHFIRGDEVQKAIGRSQLELKKPGKRNRQERS